ncbi:hypothetical protein B7C42_06372 [Nocardia cerradoensis]|uniref:Uncharacterized protein n=1 Tax=Nocardia cerradoensis TaxID=85688 RepID=A0A231GY06_9NOCA|nr:hypothetical protein [Nocardia cerradoensis]OXR41480.1 hypothetical protein B7C42_06372 [Nocardia cerradoensis]
MVSEGPVPTLFRDPGIPDGEKCRYTVATDGRRSGFELTSVVTHENGGYRTLLEASSGDGELELTIDQRFGRIGGFLRAEDYRAETRSSGVVVSREEAHFIDTVHLPIGGAPAPFPTDIMPIVGGMTLLRGLDLTEGAAQSIDTWLAFSVHWPLVARVDKRAVVAVGAGEIECRQVRLRPSFGQVNMLLDKMIGGLLPPFVVHIEVEPPHRLVRSSFPTELALSAPRSVIELVG